MSFDAQNRKHFVGAWNFGLGLPELYGIVRALGLGGCQVNYLGAVVELGGSVESPWFSKTKAWGKKGFARGESSRIGEKTP